MASNRMTKDTIKNEDHKYILNSTSHTDSLKKTLVYKVIDYFKSSNKTSVQQIYRLPSISVDTSKINDNKNQLNEQIFIHNNQHTKYRYRIKHTRRDTIRKSIDSSKTKKSLLKSIIAYFQNSNKESSKKGLDLSILGGPHYSSDTKLGLGIVASGLYRLKNTDPNMSPSNISLYGDVATSGYYGFGLKGNTLFPKENYRIDMSIYFSSFPSKYWGIGYENGAHRKYTNYTDDEVNVKFDFLKKLLPNTFVGATTSFINVRGLNFDDISYLNGEKNKTSVLGFGIILSYDSRDFIPNPYKGIYLKIEQNFFPNLFKNNFHFTRTDLEGDFYQQLWNGSVLAFNIQGEFNSNGTPWSMKAKLGNSHQMRGYYIGQYNDNKIITTQLELRQKVYHRSGIVAWIGAGNVFPDFAGFRWNQTLPTYGLGYRWEFKKRVNIRLDYGFGRKQSSFYLNINEAF